MQTHASSPSKYNHNLFLADMNVRELIEVGDGLNKALIAAQRDCEGAIRALVEEAQRPRPALLRIAVLVMNEAVWFTEAATAAVRGATAALAAKNEEALAHDFSAPGT